MASSKTKTASKADGLNARQRLFVLEYLKDRNATKAAIRAGYSAAGAKQIGSRLLTHADVSAAVNKMADQQVAEVIAETGITLERTVKEIAKLAFFDARKMFDAKGNPLAITDLDDDTAAAIAGLDVMEEYEGSGKDRRFVGYIKKWKLADKKGALDMLMKHLGGYKADNTQKVDPLAALITSMGRSSLPVTANPTDEE